MADYPTRDGDNNVIIDKPTPMATVIPIPSIQNTAGSSGQWDEDTSTFSNTVGGGNASHPRFIFDIGMEIGEDYEFDIQLDGYDDDSIIARASNSGAVSLDWDRETQKLTGTLTAAATSIQLLINGPSKLSARILDFRYTKMS